MVLGDGLNRKNLGRMAERVHSSELDETSEFGKTARTIGVGDSGSGCERSGRLTFVNAEEERSPLGCAASGIPGTGPDASDPEVVGAADEACRTWTPAGTVGS